MCTALAAATSRDQIGEALMEYLRLRHLRTAGILPKEPNLTGWLAAGEEGYLENFSRSTGWNATAIIVPAGY